MQNQVTTKDTNRPYDVPVHNAAHGEFRNFMTHFWNMLDFPRHSEMEDLEPKIEVAENKSNVVVTAEIPGVAENDLDLQISADGYLTISGEKKQETSNHDNGNYFSEITYGMVRRTIPLPWDLDFDKADAEYNEGVLKVSIPKNQTAQEKVKKLNVKKKNK